MISFSSSQSKEDLYTLALEHGLDVDESTKKTEIINAIQTYNNLSESDTQESAEEDLSESDNQEPEEENLSESDNQEPEENLSESDKSPKTSAKEDGDCRNFVYVGPSLPNGALPSKSAFVGTRAEVEKYLKKNIEAYPQVKKLLVPYGKTASMSKRAKQRGNTTYNDCLAVESAVAENRKKQQKQK